MRPLDDFGARISATGGSRETCACLGSGQTASGIETRPSDDDL
jgi:hypothetical protein